MLLTPEEIYAQAHSSDPEERLFALVYIARLDIQNALQVVINCLQDDDWEVRTTAAWALDLMHNPKAIPALVETLYDENYHVRSTAGWALTHLGQRVVPFVRTALQQTEDVRAREMAYQVLARVGGPEAHDAIKKHWR